MKTFEVFTPAGVPTVTYIERQKRDLESQLRDAIKTPGLIASLSGPSKSGKTVLINKVIQRDNLIAVSGAAISSADVLWSRVLNWMEAPSGTEVTSSHALGAEASAEASGGMNILVAKGEAGGSVGGSYTYERAKTKTFSRGGIDQVVKEIAKSDFVVFIDDFHYMGKDVQMDVAKQIKEAAEKGVSICTASVPHRADDVVRGNPELRGRVKAIDFTYWKKAETLEIAKRGFDALGVELEAAIMDRFASEAFGSPQLMQQICLQACYEMEIDETFTPRAQIRIGPNELRKIFERAATTTDFSSLLDALHSGPKQRGTTRTQFLFSDGSEGDVYRCILLALRQDPPQLSFNYDDIYQRTRRVSQAAAPPGSSVVQALTQFDQISQTIQPGAPVVEWSEDVLDIVDPYFLYYLRCSPRLEALQRKPTAQMPLQGM
jgi:hypothetical protein